MCLKVLLSVIRSLETQFTNRRDQVTSTKVFVQLATDWVPSSLTMSLAPIKMLALRSHVCVQCPDGQGEEEAKGQ